jgi:hypothetical protein
MKFATRQILAVALVFGLCAAPVATVYADCNDGTIGNDNIVCDTTTETSDPNSDPTIDNDGVDGNGGIDTVTVNQGASVENSLVSSFTIEIVSGLVTNNGTVAATGESGIGIRTESADVVNNGSVISNSNGIQTSFGDVTNNGTVISNDTEFGTGISSSYGTIVNNGDVTVFGEQGFGIYTRYGDVLNNGNIIANNNGGQGIVAYNSGDVVSTVINNGTITTNGDPATSFYGTGIFVYGTAEVTNNGVISANGEYGMGVYITEGGEAINHGTVTANGIEGTGIFNPLGNVTNNGTTVADGTDGVGIETSVTDNIVTLGAGSFTSGTEAAVDTGGGNDTVNIIGSQNVGYRTICGNISIGTVNSSIATVNGLVDGNSGNDTLNFIFNGYDSNLADELASGITSANFETINNSFTLSAAPDMGPQTLHDDGVLLAFSTSNGMTICSGQGGVQAGIISFAALDNGQTTFNAGNGWYVAVTPLSNGQYQVHLFDPEDVEHFNDANHDGVNDSPFILHR